MNASERPHLFARAASGLQAAALMAYLTLLALGLSGCEPEQAQETASATPTQAPAYGAPISNTIAAADKALWDQAQASFRPLPAQIPAPASNPANAAKLALGRQLFHDPRLSIGGDMSCNSCHNLASYGVDNRPTSLGHNFKPGERNAPSIFNAGLNVVQFWDGRSPDLEAQALAPILDPNEMAMQSGEQVIARLRRIPEYRQAFAAAFPDGQDAVSYANLGRAIAAFERTLVTPSPFDRFMRGDGQALSSEQKEGLKLFISHGCATCHSGTGVGGGMYQKFGIFKPYPHAKDLGRGQITKEAKDDFFFKVPSLRNVSRTEPYFHDGKVRKLNEAVKIMGETQLGKTLPEADIAKIVAFLGSLTGEIPEHARLLPVLPPPGPDAPKK